MFSLRGLFAALLPVLVAAPAAADPVRVVSSDARGVTLRIELPEPRPARPAPDGRVRIVVPGFDLTAEQGRPRLPFATALVALPPGARPTVEVLEADPEIAREVNLELGPQALFHFDPETGQLRPDWAPAAPEGEAVWPAAPAALGEPFALRRQSFVKVTLHPWRYDARARRLYQRSALTVRVSYGVAAPPADRFAASDPATAALLDAAVNAAAARGWRAPAPALAARTPAARLFGRNPAAAGGFAFDEDEPEVRVLCDSTGVWGFDHADLAAAGYPAGVPVGEVSLHRHEYVEDAAVPYVTIELPCEVLDANLNGVFDAGDRVTAFVQSWAERSGASVPQRAWGVGEVVYVTRLRGGAGLRPAARSGWRDATGLVPPSSFPHLQRYEVDRDYFNVGSAAADTIYDPFHWTIQAPYYLRDESVQFDVNDLDTARTALVRISWQGRSVDSHWNWAQIRNGSGVATTIVDSVGWAGRIQLTHSRTVFGSSLSEGRTNRWRLWGKTFAGPPDPNTNSRALTGLNWFEITYGRRFRPLQGWLPFNSAGLDGVFEILITGFTDSAAIRVLDVTDPAAAVRLTGVRIQRNGPGFEVRLQDSAAAAAPRRYVAFDRHRPPLPGRVTPVTRRFLHQAAAGEYAVIVPEPFLGAVAPLVQLREAQGYRVITAPLEAVFDEFNGGRRSSHAIKRFLRYGAARWNTAFALLVGDGSEDPRRIDPLSGPDWVPVHRIMGPVRVSTATTGSFLEGVPSDPWYGWCLDCPEPSFHPRVPEVFVGRIPVTSSAQAQEVVAKLVAYEQPQADEAWRRRMTLVADDDFSGESFFSGGSTSSNYCRRSYEDVFEDINAIVRDVIVTEARLRQSEVELFDIADFLPIVPSDTAGCQTSTFELCKCRRADIETRAQAVVTPELLSRLNAGRLWFNYQGHANERVMSHESFYRNQPTQDDKDRLTNDGRPFLFTGFSCHPNAFAHFQELGPRWGTPPFGEDLVNLPLRGAIASWASVGYEYLPLSEFGHLNEHFARALFSRSEAEPYSGWGGAVLGPVIATALLNDWRNAESEVGMTYTLLGDPGTRISMGPAQTLVTANGQPVTSGQPVRLRQGGDTLVVEADVASNVRLDSLGVYVRAPSGALAPMAAGRYTVTPPFPDTTAASGRGRRYRVTFGDSLLADSYRYIIRTVDENGRAGTFEIVLAFETVLLADGAPVNDLDVISPNAALTLRVLSPMPLDPATDLTLRIGGVDQPFAFTPAAGDTSGREWVLSWTRGPYPFGETSIELTAAGGATRIHRVRVNVAGNELRLQNALAFPNPFEDDLGTRFSFSVESATAAEVRVRVYTVTGKLVYERRESGLAPGYHQLAWDGRDAEGDKLANGIYVYRIIARNAATTATHEGRLVKLRKPRRVAEEVPATP